MHVAALMNVAHSDRTPMDSARICAVVVTYNRLDMLRQCVGAIKGQSRAVDRILVVNNDSSDGTAKWLSTQDVEFVTQPNSGGAGGFNTGIRKAFEAGFDWIWVMDDDGIPLPDCLEKLCEAAADGRYGFLNPIAVRTEDRSKLSFELRGTYDLELLQRECHAVLADWALPFNGTFLSRATVAKVGFPKVEMFIWGDEVEYYLRCLKNGIVCGSVLDALHIHPPDRAAPLPILGGLLHVKTPEEKLEHIFFRNTGYIYLRYHGWVRFLAQIVEYSLYLLVYRRSLRRWIRFLRYYADGALDRYRLPI